MPKLLEGRACQKYQPKRWERAAILHQRWKAVVDEAAWQRLTQVLRLAVTGDEQGDGDEAEKLAESVLRVLQGDRSAEKEIKELAWIVERCDNLNDASEMEARVGSDADLSCLDETITAVEEYLRASSEAELDLAALI